MTWEELVEKGKERGWKPCCDHTGNYAIQLGELMITKNGTFYTIRPMPLNPLTVCAFDKTYEQLYQIMKALED